MSESETKRVVERYIKEVESTIDLVKNAPDGEQRNDALEMLSEDQKALKEIKEELSKAREALDALSTFLKAGE